MEEDSATADDDPCQPQAVAGFDAWSRFDDFKAADYTYDLCDAFAAAVSGAQGPPLPAAEHGISRFRAR